MRLALEKSKHERSRAYRMLVLLGNSHLSSIMAAAQVDASKAYGSEHVTAVKGALPAPIAGESSAYFVIGTETNRMNRYSDPKAEKLQANLPFAMLMGWLKSQWPACEKRGEAITIICFPIGHEPWIASLATRGQAFQAFSPHRKSVSFRPDWPVLPYRCVQQKAASLFEPSAFMLGALKDELPFASVHYCPGPPPVADEEHHRKHCGPFLHESQGDVLLGRETRLAYFEAWYEAGKKACEDLKVHFQAPPEACKDQEGFLQKAYWGDAFHANPAYGALVLSALAKRVESPPHKAALSPYVFA